MKIKPREWLSLPKIVRHWILDTPAGMRMTVYEKVIKRREAMRRERTAL